MRRGALALALTVLALPLVAQAQQAGKVYRIAYLGNSSAALEADLVTAFRQGLRELDYIEGQNLVIDFRWAEGRYDRFPSFVAETIRLNVDVIVTAGTPGVLAARKATKTIPIVMAVIADPVIVGIAPELARPGGNITGSATMMHETDAKRLELLKELVPNLSRIAVLWNPTNPQHAGALKGMQAAAQTLRLTLEPLVGAPDGQQLDKGFHTIVAARADTLIVMPDRALLAHRGKILEFIAKRRLPAVFAYREFVEGGGLASYSPSFPAMFRRAATYVDKILKGANPGDLPIEQASRFELVINLKTAKALGLTIPPSVRMRADYVVE